MRLPLRRKVAFALFATLLFVGLLEVGLMVFGVRPLVADHDPFVGFAFDVRHFEERAEVGQAPQMRTAHSKLGFLNDQAFAVNKPPGGYRIFCLGGSTTYGRPYDDRTSYAGWMRTCFDLAFPESSIEVVNAGGVSYASYRVAALLDELTQYEPDLFIVYTGHNEFLEERTYREIREANPIMQSLMALSARTRVGTLAHRFVNPAVELDDRYELDEDFDTILDRTIGPSSYERDDELRANIVRHYELSLRRMVRLARGAGAEILFVNPASKQRNCAPFKSQPSATLTAEEQQAWATHWNEACLFREQGALEEAVAEFRAALDVDPRQAQGWYELGMTLHSAGEYAAAHSALERAIDEDICPLRITDDLRNALQRVCHETGVALVDYVAILSGRCQEDFGHANLGNEYFLDHVHPTIEAHGLLAKALVQKLSEKRWLSNLPPAEPTLWNRVEEQIRGGIDHLAHARAEANLACVLHWAGKIGEAGPLAQSALEEVEADPRIWLIAGLYLLEEGEFSQAKRHLEQAQRLDPHDERIASALSKLPP